MGNGGGSEEPGKRQCRGGSNNTAIIVSPGSHWHLLSASQASPSTLLIAPSHALSHPCLQIKTNPHLSARALPVHVLPNLLPATNAITFMEHWRSIYARTHATLTCQLEKQCSAVQYSTAAREAGIRTARFVASAVQRCA